MVTFAAPLARMRPLWVQDYNTLAVRTRDRAALKKCTLAHNWYTKAFLPALLHKLGTNAGAKAIVDEQVAFVTTQGTHFAITTFLPQATM